MEVRHIVRDIRKDAETYPEVFQGGFIRDKATEYRAVATALDDLALEFKASGNRTPPNGQSDESQSGPESSVTPKDHG